MMLAHATCPGQKGSIVHAISPGLCLQLLYIVYRKPFLAHTRLILYDKQYWRGDYDPVDTGITPQTMKDARGKEEFQLREYRAERTEALRIAKAILNYNNLEMPVCLKMHRKHPSDKADHWVMHLPRKFVQDVSSTGSSSRRRKAKLVIDDSPWYEVGDEQLVIPPFPRI